MHTNTIVLGSGNFYYWYSQQKARQSLEKLFYDTISSTSPVDGFEFHANWGQLYSWSAELRKKRFSLPGSLSYFSEKSSEHILKNGKHTLHIPRIADIIPGSEKGIIDALWVINQETGINDFTTHPDEANLETILKLSELLPAGLRLSIENMDPRKTNYKSINEISEVLHKINKTNVTFDICHWLENENSLDSIQLDLFFRKFGDRVNKIHYSVPKTEWCEYAKFPEIQTNHFLNLNSGQNLNIKFLDLIPKNTSWVIEGVVPVGMFEVAIKEAEELRAILDNNSKLAQAA